MVSARRTVSPQDERTPRAAFLHRAILAGGGLAATGLVLGRLSQVATSAPSPAQDVRILNFVLGLEYLESALYADVVARGAIKGEPLEFATVVAGHERAHVDFVRDALGAKAIREPRFALGDATRNERTFVRAAMTLEDTMVAAYNGQATNLTPSALAAAGRIVSVEARHAAWIRDIAGETPAEDATDAPLTPREATRTLARAGLRKRGGP
jgi:hypothetical protein